MLNCLVYPKIIPSVLLVLISLNKRVEVKKRRNFQTSLWHETFLLAVPLIYGTHSTRQPCNTHQEVIKKMESGALTEDCGRRVRHDGCRLKQGRVRLNARKTLLSEVSQICEQVAKRDTVSVLGLPNPARWSPKQHGLTLLCATLWTSSLLRFLPTQGTLWTYDHRMCVYSKSVCKCSSSWHTCGNFKVDIVGVNSHDGL